MTWNEFKELVSTAFVPSQTYWLWRGQRDSNWQLQTTFHRKNQRVGMSLYSYRVQVMSEVEYYYHTYFGEILDLYERPSSTKPDDDKMKLVELGAFLGQLQHFGFPTPLLDWTLSPYVAAFFAFREIDQIKPQNDFVRIFAFDADTWVNDFYATKPGGFSAWDMWATPQGIAPFIVQLKPMPKHNPRIVAQQGRFTITNADDMLKLILDQEKVTGKTYMGYQDLPATEKHVVMRDLELMGITEMTLFPDFEGLCRSVANKHFVPKLGTSSP